MAENDDKPLDVNLELPSFGLRRKRKEKQETDPADATAPAGEASPAPAPASEVAPAAPVVPAAPVTPPAETTRFAPPTPPASDLPAPAASAPAAPTPAASAPMAPTPAPAAPAAAPRHAAPAPEAAALPISEPADNGWDSGQPVAAEPPVAEPTEPVASAPVASAPVPPLESPAPVTAPAPAPVIPPAAAPAPAAPVAPVVPAAPPAPLTPPAASAAPHPASLAPDLADEPEEEAATPRGPRFQAPKIPALPRISGAKASVITGLVIGLLACGATWISLQGCEAIRGTSSCGGPGFLLLLAILIILVLTGSAILGLLRVPEAASTSFLAVGLLAMLVLLVLTNWIFQWWMILVIPPLAAGTYSLAHWVTTHAGED